MAARRFVDVEHAADVGAENFLEGAFDRDTAEMQDGIHALDQALDLGLVGQVAVHHFFVRAGGGGHLADVGQAQDVGVGAQAFTQYLTQSASGAGQENAVEGA